MLERVQDAVEEELERADANRRVKRLQHRRRPVSARSHTNGDGTFIVGVGGLMLGVGTGRMAVALSA